jgi:hypothetical protein
MTQDNRRRTYDVGRKCAGRQDSRTEDRRTEVVRRTEDRRTEVVRPTDKSSTNRPTKVGQMSNEPRSQRWQRCRLQCCDSNGAIARNVAVAAALRRAKLRRLQLAKLRCARLSRSCDVRGSREAAVLWRCSSRQRRTAAH